MVTIYEVLGTPSAHRVLEMLAIWGELSVEDIVEKTGLSRNNVYNVLRGLMEVGIVERVQRGRYRISENPRTVHLINFYRENAVVQVGSHIQLMLEGKEPATPEMVARLIEMYEPILRKHFSWVMHSLVEMGAIE